MARSPTRSTAGRSTNQGAACGPMVPQPDDVRITEVDTPDKIWSMVMIACDNDTGVFFFRHERKMYMRYIESI